MEKRTPIQKSIVRHKLKEIDRHPFKKVAGPAHDKALQKLKDSGNYISPNGIRYSSKKERDEKTGGWPQTKVSHKTKDKNFKAGTFGSDTTEKEKKEYQAKFHRAWND